MKKIIKQVIKHTPLRNWLAKRQQVKEIKKWEKMGRPVPPPHIIKERVLQTYASKYRMRVLVETGTYLGDMCEAMKTVFDRIYSIELSYKLYKEAKDRFKGAKHIEIIYGDSGKELGKIMNEIDQPALFWLDVHYSGGVTAKGEKDTPVFKELHHILSTQDRRDVIVIDNAHCFGKDPAYPTIEELKEFISSKRKNVEILVQDDSIRIMPKS